MRSESDSLSADDAANRSTSHSCGLARQVPLPGRPARGRSRSRHRSVVRGADRDGHPRLHPAPARAGARGGSGRDGPRGPLGPNGRLGTSGGPFTGAAEVRSPGPAARPCGAAGQVRSVSWLSCACRARLFLYPRRAGFRKSFWGRSPPPFRRGHTTSGRGGSTTRQWACSTTGLGIMIRRRGGGPARIRWGSARGTRTCIGMLTMGR